MKQLGVLLLLLFMMGCSEKWIEPEIKVEQTITEEKHCGRNAAARHILGFKKHKIINAAIYINCKEDE